MLKYRNVSLKPFEESYCDNIFQSENDPTNSFLWSNKKNIFSKHEYFQVLNDRLINYYHNFFIIECNDKYCGFIYSYDVNYNDGHCHITVYINDGYRNFGSGAISMLLFINFLFAYYNFRKVYCDVFEYNKNSLNNLLKSGFQIEGQLKKHRFFNGNYYDTFIFSIFREKFYQIHKSKFDKISFYNHNEKTIQ